MNGREQARPLAVHCASAGVGEPAAARRRAGADTGAIRHVIIRARYFWRFTRATLRAYNVF